jgi:hypothetical protein
MTRLLLPAAVAGALNMAVPAILAMTLRHGIAQTAKTQ